MGLTNNLRITPEDKIKKMRIAMTLKQTKAKVQSQPNAEQLLSYLQQEHEMLINKINAYYQIKKKVIHEKKVQLLAEVESTELIVQYQELKLRMIEQHRSWQLLTKKLALHQ